jgi:hypothetical protein
MVLYFGVNCRIQVREGEIPSDVQALAEEKRRVLIGALADVDEVIADRFLMEEDPTIEELYVCSFIAVLIVGCDSSGHNRL